MKTRYLFPYKARYVGWVLFLVHLPVMHLRDASRHSSVNVPAFLHVFNNDHVFYVTTIIFMLIGLFMVAFSKEKIEDEQISQLRLNSLQWATYLNFFIIVLSLIFSSPSDRRDVLNFNLWLPLAFFIIHFRWTIYQLNRSVNNELNK